jgi:hypothetical protein
MTSNARTVRLTVLVLNHLSGFWIKNGETFMQTFCTNSLSPFLKLGSQLNIRFLPRQIPTLHYSSHVLTCTTHQKWQFFTLMYIPGSPPWLLAENQPGSRPHLDQLHQSDDAIHAPVLQIRRFRRSDIHSTIKQSGIHRDNFSVQTFS